MLQQIPFSFAFDVDQFRYAPVKNSTTSFQVRAKFSREHKIPHYNVILFEVRRRSRVELEDRKSQPTRILDYLLSKTTQDVKFGSHSARHKPPNDCFSPRVSVLAKVRLYGC